MKIKSLLLGSAAALALSGGAYAADPAMAEFVSLDVCDAYGISGLTIASDDTCLLISGEVEYEFEISGDADSWGTDSSLEWELTFDANTQTDFGRARAVITLTDTVTVGEIDLDPADPSAELIDGVELDEAYVAFGDTTVLMAGKKGTIFEVRDAHHIELLSRDDGDVDEYFQAERGGHVIQVVSEVADGFSVSVGLEDLENAGSSEQFADDNGGTLGAAVGYAGAGIDANLGFVYGRLFGSGDEWSIYGDATADVDVASVYAGFVFNEDETWAGMLSVASSFDMFNVRAGIGYEDAEDDDGNDVEGFSIGGGVEFALTDTVDLDVELRYFDYNETLDGQVTLIAALTDTITAEAYVGGLWDTDGDDDDVYRFGGELVYAPGGGFETSLGAEIDTDENYEITFAASKSF